MIRPILPIVFVLLFTFAASAQDKPFDAFRKAVETERGGFAGDKRRLSDVFNAERLRLGKEFESQLLLYIGSDTEKAYWIGFFLVEPSYLHGSPALSELASRIWIPALTRLGKKKDEPSLGQRITILRHLALVERDLNQRRQALAYKQEAEDLLASHPDIGGYVAGLSGVEKCLYAHIDEESPVCVPEKPSETIISAGILNGRAISEPTPICPEDVQAPGIGGRVEVNVIVNVDGTVLEAKPSSGPQELRECARTAALATRFSPTLLSGKPVKVSGRLIYTFKP